MAGFSGADLREVFKNLGIITGNVSDQTIDSWFDTDCEDTIEVLNWMCSSLTSENVLTPAELKEHEELVEKNLLLTGKQYEVKLKQLKTDYPGILNYEENKLKSEYMEDELNMLLEEENRLEQELVVNKNISKQLSRKLAEIKEEEILVSVERKAVEEKCMTLSTESDDVNKKLQQQICRCAENINKHDYTTNSLFLSSFPLSHYEKYYANIESFIDILLRSERFKYPGFNTTMKSARKKLLVADETKVSDVDELQMLGDRICQSIFTYYCKEIEKDTLIEQIRFLKEDNWRTLSKDESLEQSNDFKSELLNQMFMQLESLCRDLSDSITARPKLVYATNIMNLKQKKIG